MKLQFSPLITELLSLAHQQAKNQWRINLFVSYNALKTMLISEAATTDKNVKKPVDAQTL